MLSWDRGRDGAPHCSSGGTLLGRGPVGHGNQPDSAAVCNGHEEGLGSEMNYNPSCVSFVIDASDGPRAGGMCCGAGGSTAGSHTQHPPSGGALGAREVDVRDTNVRATCAVSLVRAKHLQVRVFLP